MPDGIGPACRGENVHAAFPYHGKEGSRLLVTSSDREGVETPVMSYLLTTFLPLMMYTPFGRRAALPFIRVPLRL